MSAQFAIVTASLTTVNPATKSNTIITIGRHTQKSINGQRAVVAILDELRHVPVNVVAKSTSIIVARRNDAAKLAE